MHLSLIADVLNCILRSISLVYIFFFFPFGRISHTSIVSFLLSSNTLFLIEKKNKNSLVGIGRHL